MSPVMTNTQKGLITVKAATDFSANVGCFANIGTDGNVALPAASKVALYVVEDAYTSGGIITPPSGTTTGATYWAVLRPVQSGQNFRVKAANNSITTPQVQIVTDVAGKATAASAGGFVIAIAEETAVTGQYVLLRPLPGFNVYSSSAFA